MFSLCIQILQESSNAAVKVSPFEFSRKAFKRWITQAVDGYAARPIDSIGNAIANSTAPSCHGEMVGWDLQHWAIPKGYVRCMQGC